MPKMKTHRATAKRIKFTGTGKPRRRRAGKGHYKLAKGKKRFRRLQRDAYLSSGDERVVKRMISS